MNAHLKRLEDLEEARQLWKEEMWRLGFLDSIPATPKPDPEDEEILKWFYSLHPLLGNWS